MIGQRLAPGATPAKPAMIRPSLPPLDSGSGVVMMHECQIEKEFDDYAWVEQYRIRCKCHSAAWMIWRPGDPAFVCPTEADHGRTHNMPKEDE